MNVRPWYSPVEEDDLRKARLFLKMVDEEIAYGGHWIDFGHNGYEDVKLGDAFEAALRILREVVLNDSPAAVNAKSVG